MTTQEALDILKSRPIRSFTLKELKTLGRPIVNTAKKRVRALEEKDMLYSPAYQGYIVRKGMTGSLAGTNINKIRHEVYEAINFLEAKTSLISGARDYDKTLFSIMGPNASESTLRELIWSAFEIVRTEAPQSLHNYNYREVLNRISESLTENVTESPRELMESAMRKLGYVNMHGVWVYKLEDIDADDWDDIW